MIEKFVIYNKNTKEYFKRGHGRTTEQKRARLYSRRSDAANSLRRQGGAKYAPDFEVYPVQMDLSVAQEFDTFDALIGVTPLPFAVATKYFREMYSIDIAGTQPQEFPMCVDMIGAFLRNLKFLKGWSNGDNFMITSATCEKEQPLPQMLCEELIRMFGYNTQGRRVAVFQVDWLDDEGGINCDY